MNSGRRLKVELVTHCYQYTTLLRHQLSSLVNWPPSEVSVKATVFYTGEDDQTSEVLKWFGSQSVPNVTWNWQELPALRLCRRSIGRNLAALSSQADWVWFCDADYWFTGECWKAFMEFAALEKPLIYPRYINRHKTHDLGDACIARSLGVEGLVFSNVSEFEPVRMRRAIGGIQIARGEICRARGYLADSKRAQTPVATNGFARCREDVWFRRQLGTSGEPVDLPGVYRIRHSKAGRSCPGLKL